MGLATARREGPVFVQNANEPAGETVDSSGAESPSSLVWLDVAVETATHKAGSTNSHGMWNVFEWGRGEGLGGGLVLVVDGEMLPAPCGRLRDDGDFL
jgi:hypothetical protein